MEPAGLVTGEHEDMGSQDEAVPQGDNDFAEDDTEAKSRPRQLTAEGDDWDDGDTSAEDEGEEGQGQEGGDVEGETTENIGEVHCVKGGGLFIAESEAEQNPIEEKKNHSRTIVNSKRHKSINAAKTEGSCLHVVFVQGDRKEVDLDQEPHEFCNPGELERRAAFKIS